MAARVAKLNPLQRDAVVQTADLHGIQLLEAAKTFVVFNATPAEALEGIRRAIAQLPGRGHPKASLHAVRRKLEQQLCDHQREAVTPDGRWIHCQDCRRWTKITGA